MTELPNGLGFVRRTEEFTPQTVPAGLLRNHRVAKDLWGQIVVLAGMVTFVVDDTDERHPLETGASMAIAPGVVHHVELSQDARFAVEFYR